MLPAHHEFTKEDLEVRRILRHTFLKDETSKEGLAIVLSKLGTWSSDPDIGPGRAHLRAAGMQFLEDLGINHEARELAMVLALAEIAPVEAPSETQRSTE